MDPFVAIRFQVDFPCFPSSRRPTRPFATRKTPKDGSPFRKRTVPLGSVTLVPKANNTDCAFAETVAVLIEVFLYDCHLRSVMAITAVGDECRIGECKAQACDNAWFRQSKCGMEKV